MTMDVLPGTQQLKVPTKLFKRGTKGEVRQWYKQLGHDSATDEYGSRTVSGTIGGKQAISGWSTAKPKNVGKANATTSMEQAVAEAKADYAKKLRTGYFVDSSMIDQVKFTKPMLATAWEKRKDKIKSLDGIMAQPKLDGIRCIARADGLWTRTGKRITSCRHIIKELEPVFSVHPNLILDGELYNHELQDNFNEITSIVRKTTPTVEDAAKSEEYIQYHVYDIVNGVAFGDRSLELLSLFEEFGLIDMNTRSTHLCVRHVETVFALCRDELDSLYARWIEEGYEGQMIRLNTPYENKRSNSLMKRKDFITEEFPVVRVAEGQGNWAGYAKRFVFLLPDGRECGAGVRGDQKTLKTLLGQTTPDWCTVRYFTPTPDGMPRFPVVVDWGWGKRDD